MNSKDEAFKIICDNEYYVVLIKNGNKYIRYEERPLFGKAWHDWTVYFRSLDAAKLKVKELAEKTYSFDSSGNEI